VDDLPMPAVKWNELIDAYDWANVGGEFDNAAYVDLETGALVCTSDADTFEGEVPDDLESSDRYLVVPTRSELELGRRLALSFADQQLPDDLERVVDCFRRAGAYSRFKDLLAERGKLDAWHAFENAETERALRGWCADNEIDIVDPAA
jgi:hypothetical protein